MSNNSNRKNLTIVFTQDGEHIHNWESDTQNLEPTAMLEAACS
ncbi:hypothetical protein [Pseudoalteromonas sp. OFAV1]|nr:hypothetical protein [Pseudoalteromonas sp. OFAV1]